MAKTDTKTQELPLTAYVVEVEGVQYPVKATSVAKAIEKANKKAKATNG